MEFSDINSIEENCKWNAALKHVMKDEAKKAAINKDEEDQESRDGSLEYGTRKLGWWPTWRKAGDQGTRESLKPWN